MSEHGMHGEEIGQEIPGPNSPPREIAYQAYRALERRGLVTHDFFDDLAEARPARRSEIEALRRVEFKDSVHYSQVQPDDVGYLHYAVTQVVDWLQANDEIGSLEDPRPFIRATLRMRLDAIKSYASELAFFGGQRQGWRIALIGATTSLVGAPRSRTLEGSLHYLLRYLGAIEGYADRTPHLASRLKNWLGRRTLVPWPFRGAPPRAASEDRPFLAAFELAMGLTSLELDVEFVAKVLHRRQGADKIIVASPIYVALAGRTDGHESVG